MTKKLLLALLVLVGSAWGQAFYQLPTPRPGAVIRVCPVGTSFPCPTPVNIFQDSALSIPIVQPYAIGPTGQFGFWVANGQYLVQIAGSDYTSSYLIQLGGGATGGGSYAAITAGSNTVAKTEGTGGSLAPTGLGQVVATQQWMNIAFAAPILTANNSGGSLLVNHTILVEYTLNSAAGETNPSSISTIGTPAACGGNNCQVVVTAPFIPAGFTGYTVYDYDSSAGGTTPHQQNASLNCVNILTSCTINIIGAGALAPTNNTAYIAPSPIGTDLCTPNTQPSLFLADSTGTYYPYMGIDAVNTGANPPAPYAKLSYCRPVWFTDGGIDPPGGQNALVLVSHRANGATVNTLTNQDRGVFVSEYNTPPGGTDGGSHYGLEAIQAELDVRDTLTITGSPDAEESTASFQLSWAPTAFVAGSGFGANAIRATHFRQVGSVVDPTGMNGMALAFVNQSTVNAGGIVASALNASCSSTVVAAGLACYVLRTTPSNTGTFPNGMGGILTIANGSFVPGANDFFIRQGQRNWPSNFNSKVYFNELQQSDFGALPIDDSISVKGGVTAARATTPTVPNSPTCTGGASQYTYVIVAVDSNGGKVPSASIVTPSTCVNPLTSGNPVTIVPLYTVGQGSVSFDIYRTAGPMSTGKIISGYTCGINNSFFAGCNNIIDNGLAGDATSPPTQNTTGSVGGFTFSTQSNCSAAGTAANPSVVSCGSSASGAFSCDPAASTGTCVVNTTAVTLNSRIFIQPTASSNGRTCNAAADTSLTAPRLASQVAATSFTINLGTFTTTGECFNYWIVDVN